MAVTFDSHVKFLFWYTAKNKVKNCKIMYFVIIIHFWFENVSILNKNKKVLRFK